MVTIIIYRIITIKTSRRATGNVRYWFRDLDEMNHFRSCFDITNLKVGLRNVHGEYSYIIKTLSPNLKVRSEKLVSIIDDYIDTSDYIKLVNDRN